MSLRFTGKCPRTSRHSCNTTIGSHIVGVSMAASDLILTNVESGYAYGTMGSGKIENSAVLGSHFSVLETPYDDMRVCPMHGPDAPVLLLLWFMFALLVAPAALMNSIIVGYISLAYCLVLSVLLTCFCARRSVAWLVYSVSCFLITATGVCVALNTRQAFPPAADPTAFLNYDGLSRCILVLLPSLFGVLMLSKLLPLFGIHFIGSSEAFAQLDGWGWQPEVCNNMVFGWRLRTVTDNHMTIWDREQHHPRRLMQDLLQKRVYRSGEIALDYIFMLANDHDWLAVLFHHPAHPFSRFQQFLLLIILASLIVFPVSAVTSLGYSNVVRLAATVLLITGPRSLLRDRLKQAATASAATDLLDTHAYRGKARLRHFVRNKIIHKGRGMLVHAANCALQESRDARSSVIFLWATLGTGGVCGVCCWVISANGHAVGRMLLANLDGLAFMFTLRLVFQLLQDHRDTAGTQRAGGWHRPGGWFVGFFHRWWHESKEYGALLRSGTDAAALRHKKAKRLQEARCS